MNARRKNSGKSDRRGAGSGGGDPVAAAAPMSLEDFSGDDRPGPEGRAAVGAASNRPGSGGRSGRGKR